MSLKDVVIGVAFERRCRDICIVHEDGTERLLGRGIAQRPKRAIHKLLENRRSLLGPKVQHFRSQEAAAAAEGKDSTCWLGDPYLGESPDAV